MFSFLYRDSGSPNLKQSHKITLEEFERHCTSDSLWVSIGKKVYDITNYISNHPGGTKCLMANAATDITYHAGFHSKKMKELLKPMLIGELDSSSVRILQHKAKLKGHYPKSDCCSSACC